VPPSLLKDLFIRKYSRKYARVSAIEKAIGLIILIGLAAIAFAIYAIGSKGGPQKAVAMPHGVDKDVSHAGPMIPVGLTLPASNPASSPSTQIAAANASATASAPASSPAGFSLSALAAPSNWKAGTVETFNAENLYEKIDGRADAYLNYDVKGMQCVTLTDPKDPNRFIDVYAYDMGSARNAFGIYSTERTVGAPIIDLGEEGYDSGGSLFFIRGKYYNQVLASESTPEMKSVAAKLAAALAKSQPPAADALTFSELLPKPKRIADSITFIHKNALSQEFLTDVVAAKFDEANPILGFVHEAENPAEAKSLLQQYEQYLKQYGKPISAPLLNGASASAAADIGGVADFVFVSGNFFAGVTQAADQQAGLALENEIAAHLQEVMKKRESLSGFQFGANSLIPASITGGEWALNGKIESFGPENLYEKIDGRAEEYLSFGFTHLDCASFAKAGKADEFVDVYVYDHGTKLNTFGMFSAEKTPDAEVIDLGRVGYLSQGSVFFCKGTKYVQAMPGSDSEEAKDFALKLAQAVEARISDTMGSLPGANCLPAEGMKAGSLQYIPTNALSQDYLNRVFTAYYQDETTSQTLRAFVTRAGNEDEAKAILTKYKGYLAQYGKLGPLVLDGLDSASGEMAGTTELVFAEGTFFGGVNEAPTPEAAKAMAQKLDAHLKEVAAKEAELAASGEGGGE